MNPQEIAYEWRQAHGYTDKGGFVLVHNGEACGWFSELPDPTHWGIGTCACEESGNLWHNVCGNAEHGDECWELDFFSQVYGICEEAALAFDISDPASVDSFTAQLLKAGIPIDEERTRTVREQSPDAVAIFADPDGKFYYIHWDISGEFSLFGYSDGDTVGTLWTEKQALEGYNWGKAPLTLEDLAPLRFIIKDGVKYFDSDHVYEVYEKKQGEWEQRREALRTVTLSLPDEFLDLCEECKVDPSQVLRGFVADLCCLRDEEYSTNGSDERDLAEQYFERCGYRFNDI